MKQNLDPDNNSIPQSHLKAALRYRRMGYSVIPVKPRGKEALISWTEYQKRQPTEEEIRRWWGETPDANVAIVLGKVSGIMTLEVDDIAAINGRHIPVTPQAISGGRELPHIYFKYTPNAKNYKKQERGREIFSLRGNGQYVLAPPSVHPSGKRYQWAPGLGIHETELADPPDWMKELITQPPMEQRKDYSAPLENGIPEGGRNEYLFSYGCRLLARGLSFVEVEAILVGLNQAKCHPPLPDRELQAIITSIGKYDIDEGSIPLPEFKVHPFPVGVFPQPIQSALLEFARAVVCPIDYLAVPLLSEAGVAIGTSRAIQIKRGWTEYPLIWVAVVGGVGTKKSPAQKLAMSPIDNIQADMKSRHNDDSQEYEQKLGEYEAQLKHWKADKGDKAPPEKPKEPRMRQIYTTDSTIESLGDVLEANPRGILYAADELTSWALSMNQYKAGRGADRQAWLKIWGSSPFIINRKSRAKPVMLNCPLVGVVGGLPPEVLSDLTDAHGREDGFMPRLLFAYPDPQPLGWSEEGISEESYQNLRGVFEKLIALSPDEDGPRFVTFTSMGKSAWREFLREHHKEQSDVFFPDHLRGAWSKMEGYAARLALILHLLKIACKEGTTGEIDELSVTGAIDLIDYFKSHARRVYAQLKSSPEDKTTETAVAWIKKRGGTVTAREILRYRVANTKTTQEAKVLLRMLRDRGHGNIVEGEKSSFIFSLTHASTLDSCPPTGNKYNGSGGLE